MRRWLYRIATNACLDFLKSAARRVQSDVAGTMAEVPWLEPYPDRLLDEVVDATEGPDDAIVARETIELAFMAAIQHLPPRQRAVLVLRDVLAWSARETAALLDTSVVASNSALQRARDTLKEHLPERRLDWRRSAAPDPLEQDVLARYMDAWTRTDLDALVHLLKEDAQLTMPPWPAWYEGRDSIARFLAENPFAPSASVYVHVPTRANRQPAFAVFRQAEPGAAFSPRGIDVLRIADGLIESIDFFMQPQVVERFAVALPR
jgi:RNA polymerase sigma-70 factor (ECF subfamily)